MLVRTLLVFSCVCALSACGGGGSSISDDTVENSDTSSGNVLTAQVNSTNLCGATIPQADAKLVVHNDDFTTQAIHQADESGRFSISLDTQTATVSLISIEKRFPNSSESVHVDTFVDVPVSDLGIFTRPFIIENDPNCECVETQITLQNAIESESPVSSNIRHRGSEFSPFPFNFEGPTERNIKVCRNLGEAWPFISANLIYSANGDVSYWGSLSNYDPREPLTIRVEDLAEQIAINVEESNVESGFTRSFGVLQGVNHYPFFAFAQEEQVALATDPLMESYVLTNSFSSFLSDVAGEEEFEMVIGFTEQQFAQPPTSSTIDLTHLNVDAFVESTLRAIDSDADYDYSTNADADVFRFSITISNTSFSDFLEWQIIAPIQGNLADIENVDFDSFDLSQFDVNQLDVNVATVWSIEDIESIQGFNEYILQTALQSREGQATLPNATRSLVFILDANFVSIPFGG